MDMNIGEGIAWGSGDAGWRRVKGEKKSVQL